MKYLFFILTLLLFKPLQGQVILYGCDWKYFDLAMAPPNQSSVNWTQLEYNDESWSSGPAELGYGDGDEATVISSSTLTAYYRFTFDVDDPADFSDLMMQLTYDDGAVIYLNGIEVWRVNMPNGTISYNTFASSTSNDNAQATLNITSTLVTGTNLVAVEIHQRTASSTDLSFNFTMSGIPAPGVAVVTRGPYLQKANSNSLVVRWRTNTETISKIDYGTSLTSLNQTKTINTVVTEHVVFLDSLTPATKYYYRIRTNTDTIVFPSTTTYFKTYPIPGTQTPLTAWVIGDCGTGNNDARNVRNAYYDYIGSDHTDMMLFLGDNAYTDGLDTEYQLAIFQNMYGEKLKNSISWSCLGNHDGHSANSNAQSGPYYDIFTFPKQGECGGVASGTEAYYSFDFGNVHFIILDSYETDRSVGGPMYTWAEDDLQATTAYWIIGVWHHPPYSKGSHDSDISTELKQMRENFLPLFEDYGVDLVLSGHSHSYERTFFLNGHYGLSSTFNSATHTVGVTGSGSGQTENSGAYYKAPLGIEDGKGAVYVVTGSAGKKEAASLNHPAMSFDEAELGSCVLKINLDTLTIKFLRQTGATDDHFTLIKDSDCVIGASCNDNDTCTINDELDNYCYCRGEANHRYVSNSNDLGTGSLRDAITHACIGDTIEFLPSVTDTIRIASDINVNKSLVLQAFTNQNIVISGQLQTRIFNLSVTGQLTLSRITLFGGNEPIDGGAILNNGTLILENTTFKNNWQGTTPRAWTNHNMISIKIGTTYLRIN
jgi:hypothetical protein